MEPAPRNRWTVVGLLFFAMVVSYIDRGNLSIAAPSLMKEFALQPGAMGVLLSCFFWTYATFQVPAGTIIDRYGIKTVYAMAFLVWSLSSAGIALARGSSDLIALRLLLGLAEAVGPIATLAFIRRNFSGSEQGLPTAFHIAAQNIGPALGAFAGSRILEAYGWRTLFSATGLGALIWLPFWLLLAPKDIPRLPQSSQTPTTATTKPRLDAILSSPAFWAMSAAIVFSSYYWYFLLTWVPTFLVQSRGFSTREMGNLLSTALFTMAGLNIATGFLADRIARSGIVSAVRIRFATIAYACAASVLLLLFLTPKPAVLPVLLISICGIGLGNSSYWALVQNLAPASMAGSAIGYFNTLSQIAGAAAPIITGWLLGPEKNFTVALGIAGICPLFACACLAFMGSKQAELLRTQAAASS